MRLALVFDFDLTLAPDIMFDPLLRGFGLDPAAFWRSCAELQRGEDGYDLEHSYLARLTKLGRSDPRFRLHRERLREWGRQVELYPGLADVPAGAGLFAFLKAHLEPDCLEAFVVSGGLKPVIEGCLERHGLRGNFQAIFACRMAEEDPGDGGGPRLSFPRETVGFTAKTQKLFAISKGSFLPDHPDVNAKVRREDLRVPFERMLYIGDGHSDVAAFALMKQFGGSSFAVHAPGDPQAEARARSYALEQARADAWFEADYRPGSPLRRAILEWALARGAQARRGEDDAPGERAR